MSVRIAGLAFAMLSALLAMLLSACGGSAATPTTEQLKQSQFIFFYTDG